MVGKSGYFVRMFTFIVVLIGLLCGLGPKISFDFRRFRVCKEARYAD